MAKTLRPAVVVAALPILVLLFCGCSDTRAEAAPLNVAAIKGIKAFHVKLQEAVHVQGQTLNLKLRAYPVRRMS